jgi:MFS family permease
VRKVLRQRDFLLVWTGGLVSVAGDWVLAVVLPYVVYAATGSTVATAGMIVAELVPGMLLGSVAGVFVDRWHLGRVLVAGNLAQAGVVSLLLLTPGLETLVLVYVVAAGQSALAAFTQPAESALLPSLVAVEELVPANALNVLNNRIGRLLGLPLGAVLYAALGLRAVVVVDAATFVVAAGLLACVRVPPRAPSDTERVAGAFRAFAHEWVDGIGVVRRDRTIAALFVVFGLMTFGGTMFDPLTAAWVRDVLDGDAGVYALLTTAGAVSGTIGALVVGGVGARVPPRMLTGWASVIAGVLLLVRFNVPVLEVAVALSLVQGLFAVASGVGVEALAQQRVPAAYRGRVFGSLQATVWLLSLLGAVVGGMLAEAAGLLVALDLAAILTVLAGVLVLVVLRAPDTLERGVVEDSSPGDTPV